MSNRYQIIKQLADIGFDYIIPYDQETKSMKFRRREGYTVQYVDIENAMNEYDYQDWLISSYYYENGKGDLLSYTLTRKEMKLFIELTEAFDKEFGDD